MQRSSRPGNPFTGTVTYLNLRDAQASAELGRGSVAEFEVHLAMSNDGRTGIATTASGEMIFRWTWRGGP